MYERQKLRLASHGDCFDKRVIGGVRLVHGNTVSRAEYYTERTNTSTTNTSSGSTGGADPNQQRAHGQREALAHAGVADRIASRAGTRPSQTRGDD